MPPDQRSLLQQRTSGLKAPAAAVTEAALALRRFSSLHASLRSAVARVALDHGLAAMALREPTDDRDMDLDGVRAGLTKWMKAGAQPWELPAAAVHFVLACHGAESVSAGTYDALQAVSDACEDCGGDGYHQDDSHPGNPSFTCEACAGHGRVPKGSQEMLRVERAARELSAMLDGEPGMWTLGDTIIEDDEAANALLSLHDHLNDLTNAREAVDA